MSDIPTPIADQIPVPEGNVNEPASGTQGDKAAVGRLRQALPPIPGTPAPAPPGPVEGAVPVPPRGQGPRGQGGESPIPGVPAPILRPSDRPDTPVTAPLEGAPGSSVPSMAPDPPTIRVLQALTQSNDAEAREWAELVLQQLLE